MRRTLGGLTAAVILLAGCADPASEEELADARAWLEQAPHVASVVEINQDPYDFMAGGNQPVEARVKLEDGAGADEVDEFAEAFGTHFVEEVDLGQVHATLVGDPFTVELTGKRTHNETVVEVVRAIEDDDSVTSLNLTATSSSMSTDVEVATAGDAARVARAITESAGPVSLVVTGENGRVEGEAGDADVQLSEQLVARPAVQSWVITRRAETSYVDVETPTAYDIVAMRDWLLRQTTVEIGVRGGGTHVEGREELPRLSAVVKLLADAGASDVRITTSEGWGGSATLPDRERVLRLARADLDASGQGLRFALMQEDGSLAVRGTRHERTAFLPMARGLLDLGRVERVEQKEPDHVLVSLRDSSPASIRAFTERARSLERDVPMTWTVFAGSPDRLLVSFVSSAGSQATDAVNGWELDGTQPLSEKDQAMVDAWNTAG